MPENNEAANSELSSPTRRTRADARIEAQIADPASLLFGELAADNAVKPRRSHERKNRRGPIIAWSIVSAIVLVLIGSGFAAWHVYNLADEVRAELKEAQTLIPSVMTSATSADFAAVSSGLDTISVHTAKAVKLTEDPVWQFAQVLPWVGSTIAAVTEIADVTNGGILAAQPLAAAGPTLLPANFAPIDGAIPLEPILAAQPIVKTAAAEFVGFQDRLDNLDADGVIDVVADAKLQLTEAFGQLEGVLTTADNVLAVAPGMLGADGPRTYIIMFMNNAEARALGGAALSFAELRVEGGRIDLVRSVSAAAGDFERTIEPIVPTPAGFEEFTPGSLGRFIVEAAFRPSMQSAGEIVAANWQREFGEEVDAVIGLDVVALGKLLEATGPIETSVGLTVDSANAVSVLINQIYQEFDPLEGDAIYAEVIDNVFSRITSGQFSTEVALNAITSSVDERRMLLWSANAEVAAVLAERGIEPGLPDSTDEVDIAGFYVTDNVGSKLNYYLATQVQTQTQCDAATPTHTLNFTLTNTLQPDAVWQTDEYILGNYAFFPGLEAGAQRLYIWGYAPTNGVITAASVNGEAVPVDAFNDEGHPVQVFWETIPPGQSVTVSITIATDSPTGTPLETVVTPGVTPTRFEGDTTCGS